MAEFAGMVSGWHPTAVPWRTDGDRSTNYAQGGMSLGAAVRMWPTPDANMGERGWLSQAGMDNPNRQTNLNDAVRWATPTVQDASNNAGPSQSSRNTLPLNAQVGGALNPTWVEWLMGFPEGWTDCAA